MSNPLNQILYGPPGTGKTYNTINKAIELLDPEYYLQNKDDRNKLQIRFKELLISDWDSANGQIAFCTFHQSFSYEDFIEGIKPVLENEVQNSGQLSYKIEDGIFKRISLRAASAISTQTQLNTSSIFVSEEEFAQNQFYKISLGNSQSESDDEIYKYCIEKSVIALGWGGYVDFSGMGETEIKKITKLEGQQEFSGKAVNIFKNYLKVGNYVIVSRGNYRIRAIGKVTGEYEFNTNSGLDYNHFRKVTWILKDVDLPIGDLYQKILSQQTIYKLNKDHLKKEFFVKQKVEKEIKTILPKDFLIIIDEINRGNVSQVFGELITLIEEDKRAGKSEALELVLPYSKQKFSVPSNLYIIGTMNTADRSVEALDTALRRRFSFLEMPPIPYLLEYSKLLGRLWEKYEFIEWEDKNWIKAENDFIDLVGMEKQDESKYRASSSLSWENWYPKIESGEFVTFKGLDLQNLLTTINKRIEKLLNKDHQIGHAYLMNVFSWADLRFTFFNKIIPLLQEYFYGDYAKIGLVLGSGFVKKEEDKILFANFDHEYKDDLASKPIWSIVPETEFESDQKFQDALKLLVKAN